MIWNGAQFHLLVNHLPVVGFLGVIAALVVAMFTRSMAVKRVVLATTVVVGLSALAPFWSGEPAEETIEHLPGVDQALIEEHEEAAEVATVFAVVTAVAAAGALLLQRKMAESLPKTLPAVFALSVATGAAMAKTAHEGGKIRHPEIRDTAAGASDTAAANEVARRADGRPVQSVVMPRG